MKFLIQTIDGKVVHDFAITLIEAIRYSNWLYKTSDFEYIESETIDGYIGCVPVGSVEFVTEYTKHFFDIDLKPINVPDILMDKQYSGRNIFNGTNKDIKSKSFVKSMDKIKSFTEITNEAPPGNYQISDFIEIESEYRCFVYKNELVGLQNYSGDFKLFPDIKKIEEMISVYSETSPSAYTLDVAILDNNETIVVEVHDFFSCGLYGFSDLQKLPLMFYSWYNEII